MQKNHNPACGTNEIHRGTPTVRHHDNPNSYDERDPVCGMNVNPATAKHIHEHGGKKYYFCCAGCVEKFKANPQRYLNKPAAPGLVTLGMRRRLAPKPATKSGSRKPGAPAYVCPMCPEVRETQAREPALPAAWPSSPNAARLPRAPNTPAPCIPKSCAPRPVRAPSAAWPSSRAPSPRRRRKSRTARHDAPLLGRRRAHRAAARDRDGQHVLAGTMRDCITQRFVNGVPLDLPWLEFALPPPSSSGAACHSSSASGRRWSTAARTCSR